MGMAHPDFEMVFPGDNSWSTMFRPVVRGRAPHATHRGIDEGIAFGERFVAERVRFEIEDILVNGPPWKTRVALRVHDYIEDPDGGPDLYNNRAVAMLDVRWGRLMRWEDYEDTERIATWDRGRSESAGVAAG
jgi:ketosteroid isomerase-like protein